MYLVPCETQTSQSNDISNSWVKSQRSSTLSTTPRTTVSFSAVNVSLGGSYPVDRRSAVARELLSSEVSFMRTLRMIEEVFHAPFMAALASNRAIVSAHNVTFMFTDVMNLVPLSWLDTTTNCLIYCHIWKYKAFFLEAFYTQFSV